MSGPDETIPPAEPSNDTDSPPPADATEIVVPTLDAIPRGWARFELQRAVDRAQLAIERLSIDMQAIVALADSYARALDAPEAP